MSEGSGKECVYPFPCENGVIAHLWLPKRLTKADATRIGKFIEALVIDDEAASSAAGETPDE